VRVIGRRYAIFNFPAMSLSPATPRNRQSARTARSFLSSCSRIFIDPQLSIDHRYSPLGTLRQEAQFPLATCPPSLARAAAAKATPYGCGCCAAGLFVRARFVRRGEARLLSRKYERPSSRSKRTRGPDWSSPAKAAAERDLRLTKKLSRIAGRVVSDSKTRVSHMRSRSSSPLSLCRSSPLAYVYPAAPLFRSLFAVLTGLLPHFLSLRCYRPTQENDSMRRRL